MYLVVSCTECGTPRVAEKAKATTQCTRCGKHLKLDKVLVHAETESAHEARDAVGQINAQRAGGELLRDPVAAPDPGPGDPIDEAIGEAREVTAKAMRVRLAAQGLTARFDTFDQALWVEACKRLDIPEPKALEHLENLQRANAVAEPSRGTYRAV